MQRIRARVFPWREYENDTAVEQGVPRAKGDWRTKTPVFLTEKHPDAKSSLSGIQPDTFPLREKCPSPSGGCALRRQCPEQDPI